MKILYFDVETTGLDPNVHDIIQLAFILEIGGKIVAQGDYRMRPDDITRADPAALQVNGATPEMLMSWPAPQDSMKQWEEVWALYIDPRDYQSRPWPCAYNGHFDMDFLAEFYRRRGRNFLWTNFTMIDPLAIIRVLRLLRKMDVASGKLSAVAEYFGIVHEAHDALSDVCALRAITRKLLTLLDTLPVIPAAESEEDHTALDSFFKTFKPEGLSHEPEKISL